MQLVTWTGPAWHQIWPTPACHVVPSFHKLLYALSFALHCYFDREKNSSALKNTTFFQCISSWVFLPPLSTRAYPHNLFVNLTFIFKKNSISLEEPFNILSFISCAAIIKERLESYIVCSCALFTRPNNNISLGFWLSRGLSTVQHLMNIKGGSQQ